MLSRLIKLFISTAIGFAAFFAVTEASAQLRVVTSFSQDASIVSAIGGDRLEVNSLTTGVQDPHAVEPKPSLALMLKQADLLIVNGQQMEMGWLPAALKAGGNQRIQEGAAGYLNASRGVKLVSYSDQEIEGTQFKAQDQTGAPANHHYWLDPANGLIIADNVLDKLTRLDPDNADYYRANHEAFTNRLRDKIKDWDTMMASFEGAKLVSYHRDWTYLARRHGFNIVAYVEPRETIPPSARDIAELVKRIRAERVPLILISPWQPQRISHEIARQSGAKVLSLPSAVDPRLGTRNYINMFEVIYSQLAQVLAD